MTYDLVDETPKLTASQIKVYLQARYRQPEWAAFAEVADGTGASQKRWADFVAMSMWPSRGLAIIGHEIKVSKSDLRSELKNPGKAEAIAQHCDMWYLVVPFGLCQGEDIPPNWGIMEVLADGSIQTSRMAEPAKRPDTIPRTFVASLLRSAAKVDEAFVKSRIDKAVYHNEMSVVSRITQAVNNERDRQKRQLEVLDTVEKSLGIRLSDYSWNPDAVVAAFSLAKAGVFDKWQGLDAAVGDAERVVKNLKMVQGAIAAVLPNNTKED